jgi:ferredoxin
MGWVLQVVLILGLVCALFLRRAELRKISAGVRERRRARERGSDRARLQYPHVDLSRCIGCGVCVAACPEEGVLELLTARPSSCTARAVSVTGAARRSARWARSP